MGSARRRLGVLLTVCWVAAACMQARAQELQALRVVSDSELSPSTLTISKRVNEVNLVFTITDKKGRFINQMPLESLEIFDNHLPPQALDYFQQQSDLPLRVVLLIDTSDSIRERFKFEQQAAGTFLKKMLRPGKDQAMVASFDSAVHVGQEFTGNLEELTRAVNRLKSEGDTALYDAIMLACDKLRNHPESSVTRRAIILISDGLDTKSRVLLPDAQQALSRAETVMFALSTNVLVPDSYPKGDAVLDLLTGPTGGYILPARDKPDLVRAFHQIEVALHSQYALGYHPAAFKTDGSYRAIEIRPRRHDLRVRCRKGYFAPREEMP